MLVEQKEVVHKPMQCFLPRPTNSPNTKCAGIVLIIQHNIGGLTIQHHFTILSCVVIKNNIASLGIKRNRYQKIVPSKRRRVEYEGGSLCRKPLEFDGKLPGLTVYLNKESVLLVVDCFWSIVVSLARQWELFKHNPTDHSQPRSKEH
jgi:hypothetical protein